MTTDCLDQVQLAATERRLRDALFSFVVAVIFLVPATLAAFTFL